MLVLHPKYIINKPMCETISAAMELLSTHKVPHLSLALFQFDVIKQEGQPPGKKNRCFLNSILLL
jgi:hypothetical protein